MNPLRIQREAEIPVDIYKRLGRTPKPSVAPDDLGDKNLPQWSIKNIFYLLNQLYRDKRLSLLIFGGAGIGKSQVVAQFAKKAAEKEGKTFIRLSDLRDENRKAVIENPSSYYAFLDLRAGELNPEQAQGIPDVPFGQKEGYLRFLPPDWTALITNPNFSGLIFLDEINRGQETVLNSMFQFVLDRVAAGRKISEKAMIVAAANLGSKGEFAGTIPLDSALMSRFKAGVLVANPEEWAAYARNIGVSKYIIDFALSNPSDNFYGKGQEVADHNIPINPRQLVAASAALQQVEQDYLKHAQTGEQLPEGSTGNIYEDIQIAIEGHVGTKWVNNFIEWLEIVHSFDWAEMVQTAKGGAMKSKAGAAGKQEFDTSKKWALTNFITNEVITRFDKARKLNDTNAKKTLIEELYYILAGIDLDNVSFILKSLAKNIREEPPPGVDRLQAAKDFAELVGGVGILAKTKYPDFHKVLASVTNELKGVSNMLGGGV